MMMSHFKKLGTPLGAVEKYPTTSAQEHRFQSLGWPVISACNLWKLWSLPDFVSAADREYLDSVEPFDEYEEFALFGCHYVLVVADTDVLSTVHSTLANTSPKQMVSDLTAHAAPKIFFAEHPKGQGCRRFAAPIPLKSQQRAVEDIGLFGGMGVMTRLNSYDVYSSRSTEQVQAQPFGSSGAMPSSRMSHIITDLGSVGAILVGGRNSPDTALADCWLYHKWLDTWERVDDLPWPLYRHQAVDLGGGIVLVSTGRISSRIISADYIVWSRKTGWLKCAYTGDTPPPTYGATFGVLGANSNQSSHSRFGILAGGMMADSSIQQASWRWDINFPDDSGSQPEISFQRLHNSEAHQGIARFGASVASHQGKTYVVGGIIKDEILSSSSDICCAGVQGCSLSCSEVTLKQHPDCPRPLLVGITVVSAEDALLILGGSAVCFSFGTYLNRGCFTFFPEGSKNDPSPMSASWRYLRTIEPGLLRERQKPATIEGPCIEIDVKPLPRMRISSAADFDKILQAGLPVIMEGVDIGSCTTKWTAEYLKTRIGAERQVSHFPFRILCGNSNSSRLSCIKPQQNI